MSNQYLNWGAGNGTENVMKEAGNLKTTVFERPLMADCVPDLVATAGDIERQLW